MDNPFKGLSRNGKIAVAIGGAATVWFVIRQHKASAGMATSSSAIDPLTGLPLSQDNQQDPLTGETYLAEAQQYGSVQAAEQALSGTGLGTLPGGIGGPGGYGYPVNGATGTQTGVNYPDNATWAQAVEAGLTDIGYSSTDVAAAIGRYLARLPLTSAQASIVQAAIAEYNAPPSGSYTIIMAPPKPPTGSGNAQEVAVPGDLTGASVEQATQILHSAGLQASGPKGVQGAVHEVTGTSPAAGTKVKHGSTVTLHYKTVQEHQPPPKAHKPGVRPITHG